MRCITSLTDQGQGTLTSIAQIVAESVGVPVDQVSVIGGDSGISPYGGGAWASRGTAIGGEAALRAGTALKQNILALAAAITQSVPEALDVAAGQVVNRSTGQTVLSVADVGRIGYFRQDTLPRDFDVQLSVSASFVANHAMYYMANGAQASYVEVDCETGFIKMLGQWAVDDCGRIINPLLVEEQVRGGIVQGLGAVLFEECIYSEDGNLLNGTMADYLVPMADEMPDIVVDHVENSRGLDPARRQGHRRGRPHRRNGIRLGCRQRCPQTVRRQSEASAIHARTGARRIGQREIDTARRLESRRCAPSAPGAARRDGLDHGAQQLPPAQQIDEVQQPRPPIRIRDDRLSDAERATLGEIVHRLGRKVANVARPDTILAA